MQKILPILLFLAVFSMNAQDKKTFKNETVEASCGQCKFGMKDKRGCDLAVRIDGKSYFVEGTNLDSHGDAHAEDGFCSTVRQAIVSGEIVDNRFKASEFKLLPVDKKKK